MRTKVFVSTLLLLLTGGMMTAQTPEETLLITMKTDLAKGETFVLGYRSTSPIWIDKGDGVKESHMAGKMVDEKAFKLPMAGNYIKIYGDSTALEALEVGGDIDNPIKNKITAIDFTHTLNKLESLIIGKNKLKTIDLSKLSSLIYLTISENELTSLDVSKNGLLSLNAAYNQLTDVKGFDGSYLYLDGNRLTHLDISKAERLTWVTLPDNQLTSLDVHAAAGKLEMLHLENNKLAELNLGAAVRLQDLRVQHNQLKSLDLSHCEALFNAMCDHNQLESLTCLDNFALLTLMLNDNKLSTEVLNNAFKAIPDVTPLDESDYPVGIEFPKALSIANNPGAAGANVKTATDKGWKIVPYNPTAAQQVFVQDARIRYDAAGQCVIVISDTPILSLQIFNLGGVVCKSAEKTTASSFGVADLPDGTYIVKVLTAAGSKVVKFMK